jgi:hypothetical protein
MTSLDEDIGNWLEYWSCVSKRKLKNWIPFSFLINKENWNSGKIGKIREDEKWTFKEKIKINDESIWKMWICFSCKGLATSKAILVEEKNDPINIKSIIKFENSNTNFCGESKKRRWWWSIKKDKNKGWKEILSFGSV